MPSVSVPTAVMAASALSAGAGVVNGVIGSGAAKSAASAQANAATQAAQLQQSQYQQTRSDLQPFTQAGYANLPALNTYQQQGQARLTDAFNQVQGAIPPTMTQAELEKTPGYQFNLSQGLKATQNAAAARGLGVSGAALKGAATYATGLADSTYQNQFNNAQTRFSDYNQQFSNLYNQNQQGFNQLYQPAALGETAAAQAGTIGQQGAAAAGSNIAGAGQATAAGIAGSANAITSGINSVANAPLNYLAYNQLYQNASNTDFQSAVRSSPFYNNGQLGSTPSFLQGAG